MRSRSRPRSGANEPRKRFGSEQPRIFTQPLRPLTEKTTLGFECIRFAEDILELDLMPWQKWFLLHALELHPTEVGRDGAPLFRFRKVILLVGRQNGKSTVMQALTLWRMYVDRCNLVIGTAQDLEIAEALWGEVVEMAEDIPELAAEIESVYKGSGKKQLLLNSGESYKVKAASRRGGRGLSGELVLLDELREHQSWDAWAAVTKTTNARERAQIYGISNAGDASSIVLRYLRDKAHQALGNPDGLEIADAPDVELDDDEDDTLGIFEWSSPPQADVHDRDSWPWSNPALGYRISERTLASDAGTDPEWVFRTEVMCQWSAGSLEGPFPPGAWEAGRDSRPVGQRSSIEKADRLGVGVDVNTDRTVSYIAFAGRNQHGRLHVEVVAQRAGLEWVQEWLTERVEKGRPIKGVAGQSKGAPVSPLMEELAAAGLPVVDWGGSNLAAGCGKFYDLVRNNELAHLDQPLLDVAASTAVTKPLGESWVWNRRQSPTDIAPLVAANAAVWALLNEPVPTVSAYETSGLVIA